MTTPSGADTVGFAAVYRDPLWQTEIALSALEGALLRTPLLRRLHFVAHAGAARLVTTQTYSRLEHSLGVFSLTAHFFPEDFDLRAAALLHDVGHLPFSHALEGLGGMNHHRIGAEILGQAESLLAEHGLERDAVTRVLDGRRPTALTGAPGVLNLDHLDSFVRSARANGWLHADPKALLEDLVVTGTAVDAGTVGTAATLVRLVCAEAAAHVRWENVAPTWALRQLVGRVLPEVGAAMLSRLTDDELWQVLQSDARTSHHARLLREAPHQLQMRGAGPEAAPDHSLRKIYKSAPLLTGRPLHAVAPELAERLDALDDLPLHFAVTWGD